MSLKTGYSHGTFCWVDLMAHDTAAAKEFYGGLFGWTADDQDTQGGPPYTIFRHAGGHSVAGMGQMMEDMRSQGIPPLWNSYINVDDVRAVCEKAAQLGGAVKMPPLDVMQAGSMAAIADPGGATVMLWQKGIHFGAELVNDVGAFCWNELATREMDKAKTFFADLLGWEYELNENSPMTYFIIKNAGEMNGGMIEMNEQWGDAPPHWMVYFTVEDADAAVEKVKSLGGGVCVPPFDVEVGRIAVVNDPNGGAFSIIQMNAPPD